MTKIPYLGATGYVSPLKAKSSDFSILSLFIIIGVALLFSYYIIKYHFLPQPRLTVNIDNLEPDGGAGLNWNS